MVMTETMQSLQRTTIAEVEIPLSESGAAKTTDMKFKCQLQQVSR